MLDLGINGLPAVTNVFQRSGLKRLNLLGVKVESWSYIMRGH